MPFKLISSEGDQTYELRDGATLVVGRALGSDVPIFDPTVSRKHAELVADANGVNVRDLESSNGTFLNGARITSGYARRDDAVMFGKVEFRLRHVAPPPKISTGV